MSDAPDVSRDDLIWLAGLCEGEATFDAHRGRYPRIRVGMSDRDTVARVASLIGARVRLSLREAPATPIWNAEVSGDRAKAIMEAILPYMGARRSQRIAEVLAASAYYQGHTRKSLPGPVLDA